MIFVDGIHVVGKFILKNGYVGKIHSKLERTV